MYITPCTPEAEWLPSCLVPLHRSSIFQFYYSQRLNLTSGIVVLQFITIQNKPSPFPVLGRRGEEEEEEEEGEEEEEEEQEGEEGEEEEEEGEGERRGERRKRRFRSCLRRQGSK